MEREIASPSGLSAVKAQVFAITKELSGIPACSSRYLLSADRWLELRVGKVDQLAISWPEPDRRSAAAAAGKTRKELFAALDIQAGQPYGTHRTRN